MNPITKLKSLRSGSSASKLIAAVEEGNLKKVPFPLPSSTPPPSPARRSGVLSRPARQP